jgi:hypothetical protein
MRHGIGVAVETAVLVPESGAADQVAEGYKVVNVLGQGEGEFDSLHGYIAMPRPQRRLCRLTLSAKLLL